MRARMQWNGRSMSSKRCRLKKYVLFLSVLLFLGLFCCSLPSLSWFTVFWGGFLKRGTSWETHVHIREAFFIVFCAYCDPSIHKHTARSLGELPLSRQNLLQRLGGEGGGREWVWGWRSTQGGVFEGKQGDDEDSMCLQSEGFVCGVSGGEWREWTGVKPHSDPKSLKAAVL